MMPLPSLPDTDWTRLEKAGSKAAREGWFCENYQPAILRYLCTRYPHHEAEDLCQEFFASVILRRGLLAAARREKGSLRALLSTSLERFLINQDRNRRAQKRGAGVRHQSLDRTPSAGTSPPIADAAAIPPDRAFDRAWATALLERAMTLVEADCARRGRQSLFEALRPALEGASPAPPHAEIARDLGMSTHDVTVALGRLRQRVAKRLYEEVAATVAGEQQLSEEWANVRHALGSGVG